MQTAPQTHQDMQTAQPKPADTAPKAKPRELAFVAPLVDVLESDAEILVVADVPGVKAADLEIHYEKDTLTFVGKRPEAGVAYQRSFSIPREVDPDAIHAELADGVLKLHLGRHASRRARSITVKGA